MASPGAGPNSELIPELLLKLSDSEAELGKLKGDCARWQSKFEKVDAENATLRARVEELERQVHSLSTEQV